MRTNKEVLKKIGQLHYEISLLGLYKEELTGVTIRTDELKDMFTLLECEKPSFEDWVVCNFDSFYDGSYTDVNNGTKYWDKHALSVKYNKTFNDL